MLVKVGQENPEEVPAVRQLRNGGMTRIVVWKSIYKVCATKVTLKVKVFGNVTICVLLIPSHQVAVTSSTSLERSGRPQLHQSCR